MFSQRCTLVRMYKIRILLWKVDYSIKIIYGVLHKALTYPDISLSGILLIILIYEIKLYINRRDSPTEIFWVAVFVMLEKVSLSFSNVE